MEIELNSNMLVDSPYSENNKDAFDFDKDQIEDFVNHLTLGAPTCYLVSGYRGVGKTSLIKKVEARIADQPGDGSDELVFVHTSFARYQPEMHLIRNLIRQLFLKVEKTKKFQQLKSGNDPFALKLDLLHQQTFKEVLETTDHSTTKERTIISQISVLEAFKSAAKQIAPMAAILPWYVSVALEKNLYWLIEWGVPALAIAWTAVNIFNTQISLVTKKQDAKGLYTKTLFDDEIAGTHLLDILKQMRHHGFKVVFVLDELDKVAIKELDLLINELKPYLVSGDASFIVVGGQNLYYKYHDDDNKDDAVLSSLFSKTFHVSLSSSAALRDLFYRKIVNKESFAKLTDEEKRNLHTQLDYLIFTSRLIPRRFITRLRQNVFWVGAKAILRIGIVPAYIDVCRKMMRSIEALDDRKIEAENSEALRDYIIMKMYIKCNIVCANKSTTILDKKTFLDG